MKETTQSMWLEESIRRPGDFAQRSLKQNLECDVCIVGAGIAGLTTGYLLALKGRKVCILESLGFAEGQTAQSSGHLTAILDMPYLHLSRLHGHKTTRTVAEGQTFAINKIKEIVALEDIECDLKEVPGYLFSPLRYPYPVRDQERERHFLKSELEALHAAGLVDATLVNSIPLTEIPTETAILIPQQMQLHPLKYLRGLAERFLTLGGELYFHSPVTEIHESETNLVVTRSGQWVESNSLVIATNTPINNVLSVHSKQTPYRTYVIAFRVPKDHLRSGLYWDTEKPYHYLRTQPWNNHDDLLIVGGEDHKTGQTLDPLVNFEHLADWTKLRFPFAIEQSRWSGQIMTSIDGLAFMGRSPSGRDNVYVITGQAGAGLTQSTIGAAIVTDQIIGIKNPWEELYSPGRFKLGALGSYISENANVMAQYADWLTFQSQSIVKDLPIGEGIVVNHGLKKIAAYRNDQGELETYSAACPHLGGVIHWNSAEKSWDCPCHGSRFSCNGTVIEGPACENLTAISDPEQLEPSAPQALSPSAEDATSIERSEQPTPIMFSTNKLSPS